MTCPNCKRMEERIRSLPTFISREFPEFVFLRLDYVLAALSESREEKVHEEGCQKQKGLSVCTCESPFHHTRKPAESKTEEPCAECDGLGRVSTPCPEKKRGCLVLHYRPCPKCGGKP